MNKEQMRNNLGKRMLLQPAAHRLRPDGSVEAPPSDDWWLVDDVTAEGVKISDPRSGANRVLGYDHIQKYTSDQPRQRTMPVRGDGEPAHSWPMMEWPPSAPNKIVVGIRDMT
jgi:hypothetical protein